MPADDTTLYPDHRRGLVAAFRRVNLQYRAFLHDFGTSDGQRTYGQPATKAGSTNGWMGISAEIMVPPPQNVLVKWRSQATSRWLRIQSVNRVFGLTLTVNGPLVL